MGVWRGSVGFGWYLLTVGTCSAPYPLQPDRSAVANHLSGTSPDPSPPSVSPAQSSLHASNTQVEILNIAHLCTLYQVEGSIWLLEGRGRMRRGAQRGGQKGRPQNILGEHRIANGSKSRIVKLQMVAKW